jgi:virginiamycin B lyase
MFTFSCPLVLLSIILFTLYPQIIFAQPAIESVIKEYLVPPGSHPHDVAPASNGSVWYTAQRLGELGLLDPISGKTQHIALGHGSAPHGVIVGPDKAPWITDGGLNAIVRVDPSTKNVTKYQVPERFGNVNLNTATFDNRGILWFTGQGGIYGQLDPITGNMEVYNAPRGQGPYGISTTPEGEVYYASLAGSYIGHIDRESGNVTILEPPTPDQGARRVWADSTNRVWFTEWNVGNLGMYDPDNNSWKEWKLPGENPQPYAIFVDDKDLIWISDFGSNAIVTFDPALEKFQSFQMPSSDAQVRQLLGRPGEVLGAESATDKIMIIQNNK